MLIPSLLVLAVPGRSLSIRDTCPALQTCRDRQFCDSLGLATSFRSNTLTFSSDGRGLQVTRSPQCEVPSVQCEVPSV